VKPTDIGSCETKPEIMLRLSVLGTLFYVGPEVLNDLHVDTRAADVWSLGVPLLAMLAETLPFELGDDQIPWASSALCVTGMQT